MNPEVHVPSDSPPLRKHSTVISRQRGEGGGGVPRPHLVLDTPLFFWGGANRSLCECFWIFIESQDYIWVVNS